MNPPVSLNVLRRWSNRSLANAFALQAAIIALGSSLLVALISLGVIFGVEQATLRERLQEKSRRLAERVETSIDLVERSVRELANNPIFTTALLDSTGRNTYVVPFLESYKFPVVAASGLALCDINGERLAGMRSPLSDCRATSPLFKQVIAGGKTLRELVPLKNGHLAWTVYQGVVFPYTGTIEGVVVTQLDLHDILSPLPRDLDIESVALVRAGSVDNLVGAESGRGAPASLETARSPLFGAKADAAPIPLDVVVKDALSPFDRKLIPLVLGYGLGSLLLILLVIYRARRVSQQLVVPLTRLTDVARDIAEKGDLSIAVPHLDVGEVAQLARAFDVMVNTLRISEASLETKVALRTQELRKSEAAAEAANLAKSRFLATMSHEIRTPMNGILGMAQMLLMPDLQEDEQQDYARTILTSGQTLMALLNDILDLSKVEAGKFQLEIIPFDPEQLIHETRSLFAEAAALKQLRLECHWRGGTGQRYQADAHRLRQMLANFVGNAVKFTPRGTIRIEAAEIEHDAATALLEFSVIDTGIGIPEDKRDLLFLPFSQADSSTTREFGGSGLGLSIVRGLAKLMGGEVGVESEAGKGSRFWFRLRADRVATGDDSRRVERLPLEEASPACAPAQLCCRVLVVEDNSVNRMVITALLKKLGLAVTLAEDGQQGVDAIKEGAAPDLVLMDIHMPVLDGYAATKRIRQWEAANGKPRLPIVALTADAFEEDHQHCLEAGMDDYLTKPIAMKALKTVLEKWLNNAAGLPPETN